MWRGLSLFFASSYFLCPQISAAQTTPTGISIQNIEVIGSGCPAGTHNATISPDGQTFSLLLDRFVAEASLQSPLARLGCQVKVNFQVPPGWTFTVLAADYRGFAYAEEGSVLVHQSLYSFNGSRHRHERAGFHNGGAYNFRPQEFRGPFNDLYYIHHEVDPREAPWAACNSHRMQSFYLTTFLTARNLDPASGLTAQISLDSIDGQLQSQKYQLAWKACRPGNGQGRGHGPHQPNNLRPKNKP